MIKSGFNNIMRPGAVASFYLPVFKEGELGSGASSSSLAEKPVERYILADNIYNIRTPEDDGLRKRGLTKVFITGMSGDVCYVPCDFETLKEIFERHGRVFYTIDALRQAPRERKKVGAPSSPNPTGL